MDVGAQAQQLGGEALNERHVHLLVGEALLQLRSHGGDHFAGEVGKPLLDVSRLGTLLDNNRLREHHLLSEGTVHGRDILSTLAKVHRGDASEQLLEVRLDDFRVAGLAENLQQVLIADEVQPGECRALLFQKGREGLLAALKLICQGDELVLEASYSAQVVDLLVLANVLHVLSELVVHLVKALLLTRKGASAEDGLEVDPLSLDLVHA
mmetsp:Transcript_101986/g.255587  ORF Transcript_101986/g.255587 Transcript_101986/m.255587 type:complete len:210 (-) Transcript_101986:1261-1890(-)